MHQGDSEMKLFVLLTFIGAISCGGQMLVNESDLSQLNGGDQNTAGSGDVDFNSDSSNYGDGISDQDIFDGDDSICIDFIEICHYPPGNVMNAHNITIPCEDLEDHLGHGDYTGKCE